MNQDKLFIVRKYVRAKSAAEAIKIEKRKAPDDVWLDDDWKKEAVAEQKSVKGF